MRTEIPAETAVTCDRCKTDMTNHQERMELKVFSVALAMQSTIDAGPGPFSGRTLDLCGVCMRKFSVWVLDGGQGMQYATCIGCGERVRSDTITGRHDCDQDG